jgi:hypothetical protein
LATAYGYPLAGAGATLTLFLILRTRVPERQHATLYRIFAAAAIACYYWYRLPALFGFGPFPGDGMLLDLRSVLPVWFPAASRTATTLVFAGWFLGRGSVRRSWLVRPAFARAA